MIDTIKNLGLSIGKVVLIAFIAVCALFVLLAFLRIGLFYWIYTIVEDWVAVRLGFDYYVSNLAATAFTALFSLLLPMLAWYFFLGKKQAWGIGATVGIQLLICVAIYTVGSGVCFDRRTGKPLCYFADTPAGRVWSYTPGFDPASGKEFRLYTREIKESEDRRNSSKKIEPAPQSLVMPLTVPTPAAENVPSSVSVPSPEKQEAPRQENISFREETFPEARKIVVQNDNATENKAFERELELEKIRQAEETRRRQILERERREAEERRILEEENYRIRAEQERFEREQKAERERLAREERERQIAEERDRQRRREEKEKRRQETLETIVNIARPAIERLTRRKN